MSKAKEDAIAETKEEVQRGFPRQPVLLKAILDTGHYEFECLAYDLSLKGVKVKLDLPLETKCEVGLMLKDSPYLPSKVAWSRDGFIGLEFSLSTNKVSEILGSLGSKLPKV